MEAKTLPSNTPASPSAEPLHEGRREVAIRMLGALGGLGLIQACSGPSTEMSGALLVAFATQVALGVATVFGRNGPTNRTSGDLFKTSKELGGSVPVVAGAWAAGDGGGGVFYWDASGGIDDGGTIIVPGASTTGRSGACWRRVYSGGEILAEWFGAKGDGSTDCSGALTNAFAVAWASGQVLRLRSAHYVFDQPLQMPVAGSLAVQGTSSNFHAPENVQGTRLTYRRTDGSHFLSCDLQQGLGANNQTYAFKNLIIAGPGTSSGDAIRIYNSGTQQASPTCQFENVHLYSFQGGHGFYIEGAQSSRFTSCTVDACRYGWRLSKAANGNTFLNCGARRCHEVGWEYHDSASATFINLLIQENHHTGLRLVGCLNFAFMSAHFEGNNLSNAAAANKYGVEVLALAFRPTQHVHFSTCTYGQMGDGVLVSGARASLASDIRFIGGHADGASVDIQGNFAHLANEFVAGVVFEEVCGPSRVIDNGLHTRFALSGNQITRGQSTFEGRVHSKGGAQVAVSATLTLGDANAFSVSGAGTIRFISTLGWTAGDHVVLHFLGPATIAHASPETPDAAAPIFLNGSVDWMAGPDTLIMLYFSGSRWIEMPRRT